ncbi:nucleotidyltransferase [Aliifodinibius sp. S!AR15-10]|uniref:nucleotidyltransferase n=1 Tax=Aliifodinibius sp. S!AR15-10 TaxID=2950437 RepID=UPI00285F40D7|nr:nucleotidyltransferase [Aliifodinibius sp. S!AR15-10]MDR8393395.1 nucleotidyltransferase [Aliifodinibius sp. S!AR15-10]
MKADHFSADTQEFLFLLHKYQVKYMIVGGEAVIYYGYPRLTGDVDFFYLNSSGNIKALFEALLEFWNGDIPGITDQEELGNLGYVIQFGTPPNRIDLLNSIEGVKFDNAWEDKKREQVQINGESVPIFIIGLSHLLINKEKVGRSKDQDDLEYLRQIKE